MCTSDSTGTWVTMGSQSTTKWYEGDNSTTYCFAPSTIGADNQSFCNVAFVYVLLMRAD